MFLFIIKVERQTQKWHRTILAKTIFCVDFAKFCNFVFIEKKSISFHIVGSTTTTTAASTTTSPTTTSGTTRTTGMKIADGTTITYAASLS